MLKTCGFTGHRKIAEDKLEFVRRELCREIAVAVPNGFTHFICGMCDGADLEFAEIIAKEKEGNPEISLEAAIPYRDRLKTKNSKFHELLEKCNKITFTGEDYNRNCYRVRNSYIVGKSDVIIAVFDGRNRSGTAQTIRIAQKENREIKLIGI